LSYAGPRDTGRFPGEPVIRPYPRRGHKGSALASVRGGLGLLTGHPGA